MKANSDGKPTFRVQDLLDVWRIKPWFSQQKQAFNAKLQAAAKVAAEAVAAGAAGEGGLIEVDALDDEDLMANDDE